MIILQLKCKPQVYFFLRKMYGPKMKLGEYDTISTLITNVAISNRSDIAQDDREKNYKYFYPIIVSNAMYNKFCLKKFSTVSVRIINKYIDTIFELAFILFVTKKMNGKKNVKTTIEEFMVLYDIDENIYTFSALKKDFERYKNGKKKNIEKLLKKNTSSLVA